MCSAVSKSLVGLLLCFPLRAEGETAAGSVAGLAVWLLVSMSS